MRRLVCLCAPCLFALACGDDVLEATSQGGSESGTDSADVGSDEVDCVVGQLDCSCTPGGGCDPGLACVGDQCVPEEATGDTDTGGECMAEGCSCTEDVDVPCDEGLECIDGVCAVNNCGNGALDANEQCDDSNEVDGDGCDNDCSFTEILEVAAGDRHSCALIEGGRLRCWGEGFFGQLGYGVPDNVGDTETPASAGDIPLPGPVVDVDLGQAHTCARFEDGGVRCWGQDFFGQLGTGTIDQLGDDELLDMLPQLSLGAVPDQMTVGGNHACVHFDNDKLRCWGENSFGQLGLGDTLPIGDDEVPSEAQMMFLGADAMSVAAGEGSTCAITTQAQVRCWGRNNQGQLGYGNTMPIGDTEPPSDAGDVSLYPPSLPAGASVAQLALGKAHSCALFSTGEVLCWGKNVNGQLGQGDDQAWGNDADELPSGLEPISLGAAATQIAAGLDHTCALLTTGEVRCWGQNNRGQLGQGDPELADVGHDQLPSEVPVVDLGGDAVAVTAGGEHTCALLENRRVVCWGFNTDGRLGYGHTNQIGDNEPPSDAGFLEVL